MWLSEDNIDKEEIIITRGFYERKRTYLFSMDGKNTKDLCVAVGNA